MMDDRATAWRPVEAMAREEVVARSDATLARADIPGGEVEDLFRIQSVGLDWDIGAMIYAPDDPARIPVGADGRKIGVFILHGGAGDYRSMQAISRVFARKFGCKVASMTFPGRLNFDDPARDWPGDTFNADDSVRTPKWLRGEEITREQYDVVRDTSMIRRYGTRALARAKPGTRFHERMAGWPAAFEDAMKDLMARHFPPAEWSIYVTGHSTGGPFAFMISQRVPNIAGVIGCENSPFGIICEEYQHNWSGAFGKAPGAATPPPRTDPFNDLLIRTWRDRARYAGPEALGKEGPAALMRLPSLMEEVLDAWDRSRALPQFKAEYVVTMNIRGSMREAALVTARRLGLNEAETAALVERYVGHAKPLEDPGVKPVPPVLFVISKDSPDHTPRAYQEVIMPMMARFNPAPRVALTQFGAGVHTYSKPEDDLPQGIAPAVADYYIEAIKAGYFCPDA